MAFDADLLLRTTLTNISEASDQTLENPALKSQHSLNAGFLDLHGRLLLVVLRLLIAESTDHHVAFGGIRDEGWILGLRHGEELLAS